MTDTALSEEIVTLVKLWTLPYEPTLCLGFEVRDGARWTLIAFYEV